MTEAISCATSLVNLHHANLIAAKKAISPNRKVAPRKSASSTRKRRPAGDVSGKDWRGLEIALSTLGIKRGYLKDVVLPSWWEPSLAQDRNGFLETVAFIHRRTGIPLESLMAGKPHWKSAGSNVKFKKAAGVTEGEVRACHTIAQQAAEAVAATVKIPWPRNLPAAEELHALLKQQGAKQWVSLEEMVTWCWKQGIPVIHVNKFPRECTKPDGMAVRTRSGRPVIVLCKNSPRPAWQIFILAHELGHIALGHVPEGGVVVDSKLDTETEEIDEIEANQFAVTVLTGQSNMGLLSRGKMYPALLAKDARQFGKNFLVSPGVVALNWGFQTKDWATANGAVKILEDKEDAFKIIQSAGVAAVDWESLSSDGGEWMERMTGLRQKA